MPLMTSPAVNRIALLPEPRLAREAKIRRYRLARLKLDGEGRLRGDARFAHLKRVYD
jgi:hypothetical protein